MSRTGNLYSIRAREIWAYLHTQDSLFWLINIYLFFEYVRPQTIYPAIDVFPFVLTLLLITMVAFALQHHSPLVKNPLNKLLFLYLGIILISSVYAMDPGTAYEKIPEFMSWIVIIFLIINIVNTEERFLVFMLAFLIYSFKMAQFSFFKWASKGFSFISWGSGGGPGWFRNSGEFGIQMCIFFALSGCFYFALREYWPRWKKILFFLFPLFALTGTISSSSRGAVVGIACILFFLLMKSRNRFKGLVALGVIALLIVFLMPEQQMDRFRAAGEDKTSLSRIALWERGMELGSAFPYLGVGYNNWLVAQEEIFGLYNQQHPHNIFIQCFSELGYTGLIVFLLMIAYTFINNHRTRKLALQSAGWKKGEKKPFLYYMAHGLDGALVGYLASGFFVTVLYYPYFWINLAMTIALNNIAKNRSGLVPGRAPRND